MLCLSYSDAWSLTISSKRTFGFWSTFGFTSIYIATWEFLLVSVYSGLVNGGFGGLVYEYIVTSILYFSVVLSLAEMASM